MLLTDARSPARSSSDGTLVPLAEQRRELWNANQIAEGVALVTRTLGSTLIGPYQVQAAIAAVHDEAPNAETTDWPQILALYQVLERVSPGPVVTLNRAVAVAMVDGPRAGLALLGTLDGDLSAGGEDDREHSRAALPRATGSQARLGVPIDGRRDGVAETLHRVGDPLLEDGEGARLANHDLADLTPRDPRDHLRQPIRQGSE